MAHKAKISGTNYAIKKALCKVGGTNYVVYGGKTKIGSTNYWIDLSNGKTVSISVSGAMSGSFAHLQGTSITYGFYLTINGNVCSSNKTVTAKTGQTLHISGSAERWSSSNALIGDGPLHVYYNGSRTTYDGGFNLTYRITDDMTISFEDNIVHIDVGGVNLTKTGSPTGSFTYNHPCAQIGCSWSSTVKVNGTDMSSAGTTKIPKNATVVVTNQVAMSADVGYRARIQYNGSDVSVSTAYNGTASYTFTATGSDITIAYPTTSNPQYLIITQN